MINLTPKFESVSGKRSTGAALLFALVLIIGMMLIFNDPPGTKYDKSSQVIQSQNQKPKPLQTHYGWYFFRMVAVTGFVITLFVFSVKYYKRKMAKTGHYFDMRVLGKQYISAKQYLMMIRVEDRKMLLGVTDHSIHLIKEFDEDKNKDETSKQLDKPREGFSTILKKIKVDE